METPVPGIRTVLVVDDERSIREVLERSLVAEGFEVATATNGEEALQQVSGRRFDVVLLDIRMPGLSGMGTLSRLRSDYPDVAIVMVTAVGDIGTAVEAMKLGAYDYVTKPFRLEDLLAKVAAAHKKRFMTIEAEKRRQEIDNELTENRVQIRKMTTTTIQSLIREDILHQHFEANGDKPKNLPGETGLNGTRERILKKLHRTG